MAISREQNVVELQFLHHIKACMRTLPSGDQYDHYVPISVSARVLELRVRIPPGTQMSVSSECCVLSGRGLCIGLITRPEDSYQVCVCVCVWVWSWSLDNEEALAHCGHHGKTKTVMSCNAVFVFWCAVIYEATWLSCGCILVCSDVWFFFIPVCLPIPSSLEAVTVAIASRFITHLPPVEQRIYPHCKDMRFCTV